MKPDIGIFRSFSESARKVFVHALTSARTWRSPFLEPEHIMLGVLKTRRGETSRILASRHLDPVKLRASLTSGMKKGTTHYPTVRSIEDVSLEISIPFSDKAKRVVLEAYELRSSQGSSETTAAHILSVLLAVKSVPLRKAVTAAKKTEIPESG